MYQRQEVVPKAYDGAEKFICPSDIIAIVSQPSAMHLFVVTVLLAIREVLYVGLWRWLRIKSLFCKPKGLRSIL